MESGSENQWRGLYEQRTGLTDRTFRRHKRIAEQIIACRRSQQGCPNVRPASPASGTPNAATITPPADRPNGHIPTDGPQHAGET